MELLQVLEEFGLNKNESAVYLSLLQLGQSSVLTIARQTAFKRPTVYLILDSLIEKGLAVVVPKEKKKLFLALSPDRLEEELARKINLIRQALPELSALYRSETAKPSIKFFESNEGIAKRVCIKCKKEHFICDSGKYWDDALKKSKPIELKCIECNNKSHEVGVGFEYLKNGDIKWVTIGARCDKCGLLSSPVDWKIDYSPTKYLEKQV